MDALPKGKKLIIGLGTGRCGTVSLSRFLSAQIDVDVNHEGRSILLPWQRDQGAFETLLGRVYQCGGGTKHIGNVGFYWLKYVGWVLAEAGHRTRFICMQRDRAGTVDSFLRRCYRKNRDHWTHDRHERGCQVSPLADKAFPKYEGTLKEALGSYWDEYYTIADRWVEKFPGSFRIFPTEALNSQEGHSAILDWARIPEANRQSWAPKSFNTCPSWEALRR